jgi:hypothetical protein
MSAFEKSRHSAAAVVGLVRVAWTQEFLAATTNAARRTPKDLERRVDRGNGSQSLRPIRDAVFMVQGTQAIGWPL